MGEGGILPNFQNPGAKSNLFDAPCPLTVSVRVSIIGAVVGRTTEHVLIKLTFYF